MKYYFIIFLYYGCIVVNVLYMSLFKVVYLSLCLSVSLTKGLGFKVSTSPDVWVSGSLALYCPIKILCLHGGPTD